MELIIFTLILGTCALVLYLMRGVACWYFKINERIKLQKELIKLLEKLTTNSDGDSRESSNKD